MKNLEKLSLLQARILAAIPRSVPVTISQIFIHCESQKWKIDRSELQRELVDLMLMRIIETNDGTTYSRI